MDNRTINQIRNNETKLINEIKKIEQENQKLKEDYNKVVHEATAFESKVYELEEKLECSQTNEETYRLEMLEITKILGLNEYTLFDDVKKYASKLQHIINELEKWLEEEIKSWTEAINEERDYELINEFALKIDMFKEVLNKLQELKGSDKE